MKSFNELCSVSQYKVHFTTNLKASLKIKNIPIDYALARLRPLLIRSARRTKCQGSRIWRGHWGQFLREMNGLRKETVKSDAMPTTRAADAHCVRTTARPPSDTAAREYLTIYLSDSKPETGEL